MPTGIGGEVGWWCPSLDNVGNGTTTLYDLVGNNNGTLTDMDALTDWVSDTASGGVRALDFDGVNDRVIIGDVLDSVFTGASARFTISAWVYPTSTSTTLTVMSKNADSFFSENQRQFLIRIANLKLVFVWQGALSSGRFRVVESINYLAINAWSYISATFDATIADPNAKVSLFINGTSQLYTIVESNIPSAPVFIQDGTARLSLGAMVGSSGSSFTQPYSGRIDDVRVFNGLVSGANHLILSSRRGYTLPSNTRRRRYAGAYGL